MVIEVHLGLGRDEDLELVALGDAIGKRFVQGMDAFDDDRLIARELDLPSRDPVADLEIELRKLDLFPGDEIENVLLEVLDVEGLEGLEVPFPILAYWDLLLRLVIVVDGDADRADATT